MFRIVLGAYKSKYLLILLLLNNTYSSQFMVYLCRHVGIVYSFFLSLFLVGFHDVSSRFRLIIHLILD